MIQVLEPEFVIPDPERDRMKSHLLDVSVDPYMDYPGFRSAVRDIASNFSGTETADFLETTMERDQLEHPCVTMGNAPIDDKLPMLDFVNAVADKRKRKTTYVSEGFLQLYAELTGQHAIGYRNVNDGDVFQDIHPMKHLADSQSQKALNDIAFHKDLANHFVRPDWVSIVGLRASDANKSYTSFARNIDVLADLDDVTIEILREPQYHTPFDDLTKDGKNITLGESDVHPIVGGVGENDIRVFENRTIGLNRSAQMAVYALVKSLHRNKKRFNITPGTFLGEANNESVHCKENHIVNDIEGLQHRWLQKTVNVRAASDHSIHLAHGTDYLVNG